MPAQPNESPRPPRATYRMQLHPGFGFADAAAQAEYLAQLGISHLYSSPYLQAGKGSTHGYDVVDHGRVNEELGGEKGHQAFCRVLQKNQLGQVLDIVPNHMSIAHEDNAWWWDVLENGPASVYATYFDVDWQPADAKLRDTILLPILEDHYGRVLEEGKFRLERRGGSFVLRYYDHCVPLSPRSIEGVLHEAATRYQSNELSFLADCFARLPHSRSTDSRSVRLRHRDEEILRGLLERFCKEDVGAAATIDAVLTETTFDHEQLDALVSRQNYRLAFWRTAGQELDYRRFFDITSLASLRTEDEQVFEDTHALVLHWVREGVLDGLRVDHPDGLRDPQQYFERLRRDAPGAWIVAEKILEPGEQLRQTWPIAGTTGYDFLNLANGVLLDSAGEAPLSGFYAEFTGQTGDYDAIVREKKLLVLRELFAAETNRGVNWLGRICEAHRRYRDYTRRDLIAAVREIVACFPVYRTYVRAEADHITDEDRDYINETIEAAKTNRPDLDKDLFDFLRDILLLKIRGTMESEFVMRFQQQTGPVMAKGLEDTVFYCFNRLISLNEVGGNPGKFGVSLEEFHRTCQQAQERWPHSMLGSTTHDTKRSEDVRARVNLLAEIPGRWVESVKTWSVMNEKHRRGGFPDRNFEYLIYQTLVGAWPIETPRMLSYVEKAAREAKMFTSWSNPVAEYESAVREFTTAILADREFCSSFESFVAPLVEPGWTNSLSQTLLKLTAPGVPDIYQGCELWNYSLVDPDNRRPVDYQTRASLLAEIPALSLEQVWERRREGLPKLKLIRQVLAVRARLEEVFNGGDYEPLAAEGSKAAHVIAFVRGGQAITVTPRWPIRLGNEWNETSLTLPAGRWKNEFTEETLEASAELAALFSRFPVALLTKC